MEEEEDEEDDDDGGDDDSSKKNADGQRRRLAGGIELEANVVEGANTGPRAEAGGPGMAYPASATALNQHSPFASAIAGGTPPTSNPNGHIGAGAGHLPAPAAPRPTDFSVSSLLTAASTHPPGILGGSSSQSSASPPPGGPGSPAAAPETPPPLPASGQRDLSTHHPSSAVAAASYFSAAALAAAGFYNPAAHLPPTSSRGQRWPRPRPQRRIISRARAYLAARIIIRISIRTLSRRQA